MDIIGESWVISVVVAALFTLLATMLGIVMLTTPYTHANFAIKKVEQSFLSVVFAFSLFATASAICWYLALIGAIKTIFVQ